MNSTKKEKSEEQILQKLQYHKEIKYKFFLFLKCAFESIIHKKIVQKIFRKCLYSRLVVNDFMGVKNKQILFISLEEYEFLALQYMQFGQITYLKWNIGEYEYKPSSLNCSQLIPFSSHFLQLKKLYLELNDMPLESQNVKIILKCLRMFTFLSHLQINSTYVDWSENSENLGKSLSKLNQLKTLSLDFNWGFDIKPNALQLFSKNFKTNSLVQLTLFLSDKEFTVDSENFHSLSRILSKETLPNLSTLKLSFSYSNFNENLQNFKLLCQTLKKMDYLKELYLNLCSNDLGINYDFEYMKDLKGALFQKTNLNKLTLNFSMNSLCSRLQQLQILGNIISSLTNLHSLRIDLSFNMLNSDIIYLLDGIKSLEKLTHLELKFSFNKYMWFHKHTIKSFFDCISNSVTLNILKIQLNETDFSGKNSENINELAWAIQKLINLKHLELVLQIDNSNNKEKDLEQLAQTILNLCSKKGFFLRLNYKSFKPTNIDQIIQKF